MGDGSATTADELYGLDPKQFVSARNDLAKRLRASGEREEAARVAKLRRPSVAAWALDRVARERPELLEAALAAGVRLREATDAAVAGDSAALRQATTEDRVASNAVVDAALGHLGTPDAAARHQLSTTLHVAVRDDDVADELRRGVLTGVQESAGFGFEAEAEAEAEAGPAVVVRPAPAKPARRPATQQGLQRVAERQARAAADAARRERRKRRAGLEADARRLTDRAKRLAADAERAETEARQTRARAAAAADEAESARAALAADDEDEEEE